METKLAGSVVGIMTGASSLAMAGAGLGKTMKKTIIIKEGNMS